LCVCVTRRLPDISGIGLILRLLAYLLCVYISDRSWLPEERPSRPPIFDFIEALLYFLR